MARKRSFGSEQLTLAQVNLVHRAHHVNRMFDGGAVVQGRLTRKPSNDWRTIDECLSLVDDAVECRLRDGAVRLIFAWRKETRAWFGARRYQRLTGWRPSANCKTIIIF